MQFRTNLNKLKKSLISIILVLVSVFAAMGCNGDSPIFVLLTGRAFLPPEVSGVLGEVTPVSNATFNVLDLARAAGQDIVATGTTDGDGNYSAEIPETSSAAVIVLGDVRVSGLIPVLAGSVEKSFDGVTDIACQAGVSAVRGGDLSAEDLTSERIANLEAGADVVLAEGGVDFFDADSVTAAANRVREITSDGASAP